MHNAWVTTGSGEATRSDWEQILTRNRLGSGNIKYWPGRTFTGSSRSGRQGLRKTKSNNLKANHVIRFKHTRTFHWDWTREAPIYRHRPCLAYNLTTFISFTFCSTINCFYNHPFYWNFWGGLLSTKISIFLLFLLCAKHAVYGPIFTGYKYQ
jgi:hypothetical protein